MEDRTNAKGPSSDVSTPLESKPIKGPTLLLLIVALVLAGLGHFYLLYWRVYIWDAILFYAVAVVVSAWAYHRTAAVSGRDRQFLASALRQVGTALRTLFPQGLGRPMLGAGIVVNVIAACIALWVPPPAGALFALSLWVGVALIVAGLGWRTVGPRLHALGGQVNQTLFPDDASFRRLGSALGLWLARHADAFALAGWLLLAVGLTVLGLESLPEWLRGPDSWLEPRLEALRVDLGIPPALWLSGVLLLLAGMALLCWTRAGVPELHLPPFKIASTVSVAPCRRSRRWLAVVLAGVAIWLGVVRSAVVNSGHWSVIPLWLVAMAILAADRWRVDRARAVSLIPSRRTLVTIAPWLLLALVAAFAVTLYRLADVPDSTWGDEGEFWNMARSLTSGLSRSPFDLGAYAAFPLISSLFQSLWIRLFGVSIWSWRLGSVVAGTLTVVPLFLLTRRLLGTRVAWSAAALLIGSPYFLAYARIGFNSIQPLVPITLGIWLLIEAAQRHSRLLAFLAGLSCGVASLTYSNGHMGLLLAVSITLLVLARRRPSWRWIFRVLLDLAIGWFVAVGPFVLGNLLSSRGLGWKMVESFFGNAFYGEAMFSMEEITAQFPLWHIGERQSVFFEPRLYVLLIGRGLLRTAISMVIDGWGVQHYVVGPIAGPGAIFFLCGFAWSLSRRQPQKAVWPIWVLATALLMSALNTFPPRPAHLTPIAPAVAALTAMGIWLMNDLLMPSERSPWSRWIGIGLTAVVAVWGARAYFTVMPERYRPNLENVIFWRAQEMDGDATLVFVTNAPYAPDFYVWGIHQFDLDVTYVAVPIADAPAADFGTLCDAGSGGRRHCRVFYLPGDAGVVEARLADQLGAGRVATHLDAEGRAIGLEWIPVDG